MSSKTGAKFFQRTDVKMTFWYVLTFLVSGLVVCGFLYFRMRHQLVKEIDRLLLDETKELGAALTRVPKDDALKDFEKHVEARTHYPVYFRILGENGKPFYISGNFKGIGSNLSERVLLNARRNNETRENIHFSERRRPFRFISTPLFLDGRLTYIIQMGTHLKFVRKSLSNFKSNILVVMPILLILGSLGGWFLARKSLSPIGYIASKAKSITSKNLSERLIQRGTEDEMDDLIRTINDMIARLEDSFKRMAEFTADASHELKTPICAMKGEAEVLLSKARSAEEYQDGLVHFIERFDQLNRMINDLILLSKSDSSQVDLDMGPLRLDLLIKDIGDLFQVLAEQKNIALNIDLFQETVVMGDKLRLQQLFANLIGNAVKFTPEGGSIQIRLEENMDFVKVKVTDTGVGIPEEEQESIFKRFYRVDKSRSKETGGVGLGLSIAEWIVHAHRGRIEVDSELNKGSTFTVYLPIHKA